MKTLAEYNRKRDFAVTAEPAGELAKRRGHSFVIQKHAASHLHYDFRLELDGVLKSWAVPKGPSLDPAVRRLAVEVEDHPLPYGSFEGTIPQGEYGGGSVLVWDRGTWEPEGDARAGLQAGKLHFTLHGDKLHGGFYLVRSRSRPGSKPQWMLIKSRDEAARAASEYDIEEARPESVLTGILIDEVADNVDARGRLTVKAKEAKAARADGEAKARAKTDPKAKTKTRAGAKAAGTRKTTAAARSRTGTGTRTARTPARRKATAATEPEADVGAALPTGTSALPAFVAPQLATLMAEPPQDARFVFENKFDGYRALARIDRRSAVPDVRIYTRSGNDWTDKFAGIAEALACLDVDAAYLDGEIVARDADGRSSFQLLQNSLSGASDRPLEYCVFDLLHLNGHDLRALPLLSRKELLEELLSGCPHPRLLYSVHEHGRVQAALAAACRAGEEGLVCKDGERPYVSGRSADWIKVKCQKRQEFVIVGYTPPAGSRQHLGALLLGAHDEAGLRYVGRVGTGFGRQTLQALKEALEPLRTEAPPVYNPERARDIRWVRPGLVAEVSYAQLTDDKILRHPVFCGLRADKPAHEVVLEQPRELPAAAGADPEPGTDARAEAETRPRPRKKSASKAASAARQSAAAADDVTLTNPDKILFPPGGPTKAELAAYYEEIAPRMAPYAFGRPLTLVRCPEGHKKACFFQKHAAGDEPGIGTVAVHETKDDQPYRVLQTAAGLRSLVQLGALELHVWGATATDLEHPIELVFDLDPAPGITWAALTRAAEDVRALLGQLGLESFVKLSGKKGIHVHTPIAPRYPFPQAKDFCRAVARQLTDAHPDRFTATVSKSERTGKIFIDYLRNGRGATFVAPYSSRAGDDAPVAVPVTWETLAACGRSNAYTVRTIGAYLKKYRKDPWAGMVGMAQRIALLEKK